MEQVSHAGTQELHLAASGQYDGDAWRFQQVVSDSPRTRMTTRLDRPGNAATLQRSNEGRPLGVEPVRGVPGLSDRGGRVDRRHEHVREVDDPATVLRDPQRELVDFRSRK